MCEKKWQNKWISFPFVYRNRNPRSNMANRLVAKESRHMDAFYTNTTFAMATIFV